MGALAAKLAWPDQTCSYTEDHLLGGAGDDALAGGAAQDNLAGEPVGQVETATGDARVVRVDGTTEPVQTGTSIYQGDTIITGTGGAVGVVFARSEEHTSELQSLMRISYAVF